MSTKTEKFSIRTRRKRLAFALVCAMPLCDITTSFASQSWTLTTNGRDGSIATSGLTNTTVTNCNDSGPGSLREAFLNAVDHAQIDLTSLSCSKITLTTGSLGDASTANNVRVIGAGQTIYGDGKDRVFLHSGSGYLAIEELNIKNGYAQTGGCIFSNGGVILQKASVDSCKAAGLGYTPGKGGAIFSQNGVVQLVYSTVTRNTARSEHGPVSGGGVWAREVRLYSSTVSDNQAVGNDVNFAKGGGIYASRIFGNQNFLVHLYQSSVSRNRAEVGGGIFSSDIYSYKSTISGNIADSYGGGVFMPPAYEFSHLVLTPISSNVSGYQGGAMYISNQQSTAFERCTITLNEAIHTSTIQPDQGHQVSLYAAGIHSVGAQLSITGTIIAGNLSGRGSANGASDLTGNCPQEKCSIQISGANNLVESAQLPLPPDTITLVDPGLGPLANNGGFTLTHRLLPSSPAVDTGSLIVPQEGKTDQRCSRLLVGSRQDIGAFELDLDTVFANGFDLATTGDGC